VLKAMHELAVQYPRYGYRRIQVFLERLDLVMSADRVHRIWRFAGLQVPRKRPRRRVASGRPRPLPTFRANHVCAYDLVFDACVNGHQLRCFDVIDEFTRECLAIDVAASNRSKRVIEVQSELLGVHGAPARMAARQGLRIRLPCGIAPAKSVNYQYGNASIPENLGKWIERIVQSQVSR
jgi:putative transposase